MINQFSFQDVNYLLYSIVLECSLIKSNLNKDSVVDSYKSYSLRLQLSKLVQITVLEVKSATPLKPISTRTLHIDVK